MLQRESFPLSDMLVATLVVAVWIVISVARPATARSDEESALLKQARETFQALPKDFATPRASDYAGASRTRAEALLRPAHVRRRHRELLAVSSRDAASYRRATEVARGAR